MKNILLVWVLAIMSAVNIAAQANEIITGLIVSNYKNLCVVVDVDEEAIERGVTKEIVESRAMLQLRRYGITPIRVDNNDNDYSIIVSVGSTGLAYFCEVAFARHVTFTVSKRTYDYVGITWVRSIIGTPFDDEEIFDSIEIVLDFFINAYLEANAD